MEIPIYLIRGRRVTADSPQLQQALADVYGTPERPRCMCVEGGVDMYVTRLRQFVVKRMPGTGTRHHPSCDSYEPDYGQSGLGALMGEAVVEHAADLVELHVDFPLSLKPGRRPEPGAQADAIPAEVRIPKQRMSLRAFMHYLFQRAEFNRWTPNMLGKRNQQVLHKYLTRAAAEVQAKGVRLSERLMVPEAFSDQRKDQLFRERRAVLSQLHAGVDSEVKLQLVIGEYKGTDDGPAGKRVWIKHLPEVPLWVDAKMWARIVKRYEPWFAAAANQEMPQRPRLILCALVYAKREHTYAIDTVSCMLATSNWIPIEGTHEIELIEALTAAQRRFVKPLRFDAPTAGQFANAVLLDTGTEPTPLHILSGYADAKERAAKQRLLTDQPDLWVWNTNDAMPALPPAVYA